MNDLGSPRPIKKNVFYLQDSHSQISQIYGLQLRVLNRQNKLQMPIPQQNNYNWGTAEMVEWVPR